MVFAGTAGLVVWLMADRGRTGAAVGFAEQIEAMVAPAEVGRLLAVSVEPGQAVIEGEVVAQLDPGPIDDEIAVLRAERERLTLLARAEEASTERSVRSELRSLDQRTDGLRLELQRERSALEQAQGEVRSLRAERRRLADLVKRRLATSESLAEVELQLAVARREADELPQIIELLELQLQQNETTLQSVASSELGGKDTQVAALQPTGVRGAAAAAVAPIEEEIKVVNRQIDALQAQRQRLTLRAPTNGRVSGVDRRPGDVVLAAEAVVRIVQSSGDRVSACLPEAEALRVQVGERVRLLDRSRQESGSIGSATLHGTVVTMSPVVGELPLRCWRAPDRPQWGRTAVVQLDQPRPLVPGQSFDLAFLGARSSHDGHAAARDHQVAEPSDVRPILVPPQLAKRSRLEASGAVWDAAFQRYLVASDDTGWKKDHEHAPWLFTLSRDGGMGADPLPIVGLSEVKDLEALAWGPGGRLFAMSSSSKSKRGKRSPSRCGLLALEVNAADARLVGQVNLFRALSALSSSDLAALGLGRDGDEEATRAALDALDLEGLTAWDGGLLIGVKSPVDATGQALVWHVRDPGVLFETSDLQSAGISLWARLPLPATQAGAKVPGGVSDLLALPDGRVLVASTPSSGDGEAGGSVSVVSRSEAGAPAVRTIRDFPGLKPEALSASARPGQFVVLFDRGEDTPLWTELPWPR